MPPHAPKMRSGGECCGEEEGAARRALRSETGGSGWALGSRSHLDSALSSLTWGDVQRAMDRGPPHIYIYICTGATASGAPLARALSSGRAELY